MIGKSGSGAASERGGSCTDVVHEIGKARTTVVCDRNNLHEAKQRRRNGYGMHLVTGHLDPS